MFLHILYSDSLDKVLNGMAYEFEIFQTLKNGPKVGHFKKVAHEIANSNYFFSNVKTESYSSINFFSSNV